VILVIHARLLAQARSNRDPRSHSRKQPHITA
jgi:hypothetical protein